MLNLESYDFVSIEDSIKFLGDLKQECDDDTLQLILLQCCDGDEEANKHWKNYQDRVIIALGEMQQYANKILKAASNELTAVEMAGFTAQLRQEGCINNKYGRFYHLFDAARMEQDIIEPMRDMREIFIKKSAELDAGDEKKEWIDGTGTRMLDCIINDFQLAARSLDARRRECGMGLLAEMHDELFANANKTPYIG